MYTKYKVTYRVLNDRTKKIREKVVVSTSGIAASEKVEQEEGSQIEVSDVREDLPTWGNSYIGKVAKFGASKVSEKIEERNNRTPEEIAFKEEQDRLQRAKVDAADAEFLKQIIVFMKKYWYIFLIAVGLIAGLIIFNKSKKNNTKQAEIIQETSQSEPVVATPSVTTEIEQSNEVTTNLASNDANGFSTLDISNIKGEYTGDFGKDELTITINDLDLDGGNVIGFDVVKGNKRDLKGVAEKTSNSEEIKIKLSEPGDDKWDGVFTCVLNYTNNTIIGKWSSNNGKSTKDFTLIKK